MAASAWGGRAAAGPPLISDDPNTIGPGAVQPIVATSVFHRPGNTLVQGPILDLTVGAVESLDLTIIASMESRYPSRERGGSRAGLVLPGLKWEPISTPRARVAFSPAFGIVTVVPRRPFFLLPIQAEFPILDTPWVLGFDLGYVAGIDSADEWFFIPYARFAMSDSTSLLFEVWTLGVGRVDAIDLGASVGLDATLGSQALHVLLAVGTGFVSRGREGVGVRAYTGLQVTFGL